MDLPRPGLCALAVLLLPALAAAEPAPDLGTAYAEASQLYGVPEPLLRALVDAESDGHMNPFPTRDGRWGLTGLVPGRTLERAAGLTGFSIHDLTSDPRANLLGGAAALAEIARTSGSLDETLFRWASFDVPSAGWDYAARIIARLQPRAEYVRLAFPGGAGWMPADTGSSQEPLEPKATPDYPGARWVGPACDYTSGRSSSIDMVIIHTCEGGFSGCWGWLTGCHEVSAHYVVSEAGEVVQCVEDHDTAWHAGCVNSHSIGIEHEGSATTPEEFTDAMYCASAQLTRWLCDNEGVPRDRSHVIGHGEANDLYCGGTHWDPGPGWDWTKYMDYVECGCGGCTPTRPLFDLRAEIADVAGQDRDFCTLDDSGGIFDLNAGQTTTQRFYVTNNGDAIGRNIVVGLMIEEPYLRLRRWDIYDNWPTHTCGAEWCLNDSNTHPSNPAHDDPGAAPLLYLYGLSPGETKMIEMTIEATGYSVGVADHPDVRLWVKHVDDFYEKNDFGSTDYNNVGGFQTYNGGDLRVWTETDILAAEACSNGLDDDCDGTTDEDCQPETDADAGGDGGADDGSTGDGLHLDVPVFDAADGAGGGGDGDGCGCRTSTAGGSWWPAVLAVVGLGLGRRRRR